jgi:hypothetical protein
MEDLLQKLNALLRSHFQDCELEVEYVGEGRVSGFLIWEGFAEYDHIDRQRKVWGVIRQNLSPEEQSRIVAVLTMTPEEMTSARAG